jgi:hypothetical protein
MTRTDSIIDTCLWQLEEVLRRSNYLVSFNVCFCCLHRFLCQVNMLTCLYVSETGSTQHSPSGRGDALQEISLFGELTNTSCRVLKRELSSHTSSFFLIIQ